MSERLNREASNPSIEGMPKRLRLLRPPHVKLQGLPHLSSKFKP